MSLSPDGEMPLNLENLRDFKSSMQRELERKQAQRSTASTPAHHNQPTPKQSSSSAKAKMMAGLDPLEDILNGIAPSTPTPQHRARAMATPDSRKFATPKPTKTTTFSPAKFATPTTASKFSTPVSVSQGGKFATRNNKGKVEESLNSNLAYMPNTEEGYEYSRCTLSAAMDPKAYNYRYMFEKISTKSEVLDDLIEEFAQVIKQHYNIEQLDNPGEASQSEITAVGRICCDHELSKMNEQGVILESSRMMGNGCRVPLRLGKVPSFCFFPGQIVGVQGVNSDGKGLVVSKVLEAPLLPMVATPREELIEFNYSQTKLDGKPMNVLIAQGPYTLDDNLLYEPFTELMSDLKRERPDVVVLLGPFVDEKHPLILSADCDQTPEELFANRISAQLEDLLHVNGPATTVILIPHVRDMVDAHIAYPQSPLDKDSELGLNIPKAVKCLPNPAVFSINEIVFGITNNEVLFNVGQEECSRAPARTDRLGRLTRHILEQRSFYPLFPASQDANLDLTHAHLMRLHNGLPDVMVIPSQLRYFTKVVDNVVCVNPGALTKSKSGGTYARMSIVPMARDVVHNERVDEDYLEHQIWDRARVDIVRV